MATIRGYRGYTIWTKQHNSLWHIFYRAPYGTANHKLVQVFENEKFGLRVAEIVIDSRIGFVGPVAA